MKNSKKALIVGCGIAGAAAALFFKRAGVEAEVYEAREESEEYSGLFLNTASNGLKVLKALGLDAAISAEGFAIPRMVMWSGNGKRLGEVPNGAQSNQGAQSVLIKRGTLNKFLQQAVQQQGIPLHSGKKLKDIEVIGSRQVIATFGDGTTAEGDFLVGCDGIHSRTRQLLMPEAPEPSYTGLISTGGFSHTTTLAPTLNMQHFVFGKEAFFGYIVKPSGEVYWFNNYGQKREPGRNELDEMSTEQWKQRLSVMHKDDQPFIRELIQSTVGEIGAYPVYDIPFQPLWHKGPVVLVGDAVHAVSPSAGQGASMALEDTLVLAKCLRDIPDVQQAFARYESIRRERTEKMVQISRRNSQNKTTAGPVSRWFRDMMLPFFLKGVAKSTSNLWIYAYALDWDERIA